MPDFYGTLAGAESYHADRGNTAWTGSDIVKQAALVRASAYIDGRYRLRWPSGRWVSQFPGVKAGGRAQQLEWPRSGAIDYEYQPIPADTVPDEVERATYEAALRELVVPGSLSPDYSPSSLIKSETVGPLKTDYAVAEASAGDSPPNRPVIPAIDEILAPVLTTRAYAPGVLVV